MSRYNMMLFDDICCAKVKRSTMIALSFRFWTYFPWALQVFKFESVFVNQYALNHYASPYA